MVLDDRGGGACAVHTAWIPPGRVVAQRRRPTTRGTDHHAHLASGLIGAAPGPGGACYQMLSCACNPATPLRRTASPSCARAPAGAIAACKAPAESARGDRPSDCHCLRNPALSGIGGAFLTRGVPPESRSSRADLASCLGQRLVAELLSAHLVAVWAFCSAPAISSGSPYRGAREDLTVRRTRIGHADGAASSTPWAAPHVLDLVGKHLEPRRRSCILAVCDRSPPRSSIMPMRRSQPSVAVRRAFPLGRCSSMLTCAAQADTFADLASVSGRSVRRRRGPVLGTERDLAAHRRCDRLAIATVRSGQPVPSPSGTPCAVPRCATACYRHPAATASFSELRSMASNPVT